MGGGQDADDAVRREMRRRSRRSFLVAGLAAAGGYGFWRWVSGASLVGGLQHPLRAAERFNGAVSRNLLGVGQLAPTFPASSAVRDVRLNGDIGLDTELKLPSWRLQLTGLAQPQSYRQFVPDVNAWKYESVPVEDSDDDSNAAPDNSTNGSGGIPQSPPPDTGGVKGNVKGSGSGPIDIGTTTITINEHDNADVHAGAQPGVLLTMEDVRALPHVELTNEFKCIEGWSEIVHWGGVRFADLIERYPPMHGPSQGRPRYVSLETPNGDYFVGLEMADAMHPQTLLCYDMNDQPLSMDHGAPLRLVIPLKYGIKHLKQIGKITFTNDRPRDYWAEQSYDWYAGH
ncbi:MAG: molybdopterin-dependent oxidoreductase [Acidobacteriaceae bacterium]